MKILREKIKGLYGGWPLCFQQSLLGPAELVGKGCQKTKGNRRREWKLRKKCKESQIETLRTPSEGMFKRLMYTIMTWISTRGGGSHQNNGHVRGDLGPHTQSAKGV